MKLTFLAAALAASAQAPEGKPWYEMDYGPYLTASIEVAPNAIAYKGVAVRLDPGAGGVSKGSAWMVFETDTLSAMAGWTGKGFIDWKSIVFDGSHQTHPKLRGSRVFTNPVAPGWGRPADGSFEDPRLRGNDDKPYGPLPRDWAEWKGLYVHGDRVVFAYTVGGVEILESPGLQEDVFVRTINLGARERELLLQVAREPGRTAVVDGLDARFAAGAPRESSGGTFAGEGHVEIPRSDEFDLSGSDYTITARVKTRSDGTIFAKAPREGNWARNGKSLFLRGGRLTYDIGWVGEVRGRRRVNDGKWHDVALTWERASGRVTLYVDGKADGEAVLAPKGKAGDHVVRLAYTSPNFPGKSRLEGSLDDVRFYGRALAAGEIAKPPAKDTALVARWMLSEGLKDLGGGGRDGKRVAGGGGAVSGGGPLSFRFLGGPAGSAWTATEEGDLRLKIPAGGPVNLAIGIRRGEIDSLQEPEPLARLTRGGAAKYAERTVETKVRTEPGDGAYAIDHLTVPMKNPWNSWMRLGGFDFFDGGTRAAVCTWMGDVWTVDGIGGETLTWRRIATGMFQPLGLKIVKGDVYVSCRDQVTRLRDVNGDGEADFYESFNHDHQVTEHFHEFAMDLQTDAKGNFYYAKSARHAKDSLVPQHGTLMRVSPDGKKSEIVCNGFRAANGVGLGPDGEMATSDQEGHWTPANRINLVRDGGFYGNMYSYHRGEKPTDHLPPLVWLPKNFDRSPAEQLWVPPGDRWGPFGGKMLSLSYGTGRLLHVMVDRAGGTPQGAAVEFPFSFPTGSMRGRFHPGDGQLYVCGLFGWSSNKTRPGGFYRVRHTGKPARMPLAWKARADGVELTFTEPLDPETATDPDSYAVKRWNYRWTGRYGSPHYGVKDPDRKGEDGVKVLSATLSKDGRTVRLALEDFGPVMQLRIDTNLRAAAGGSVRRAILATVHEVPAARDR